MAVCTTPCPYPLQKPAQAFPDRLPLDAPVSTACLGPRVGQSAQVAAPLASCRWGSTWRPLERHPHRLCGMHGQAVTGTPLRQDVHHPAGVGFQREADDQSIGTASQHASARHPGADVLDKPCVQDMMQAYLGEHGRTAPALWRTLVGVHQRSRLQHARVQPRAKPSQHASITDPLLDTLPQRAPVQVVEQSTDIRIDSPVAVPRPALLTQLVPRLMLTVPLFLTPWEHSCTSCSQMASQIITTARWTRLSSKHGFPLGLFCPSSFSIHTRSTGGATYRLSRSRSCRSRRVSARVSASCFAVTWSMPGALRFWVWREASSKPSWSITCNTLLHTLSG